MIEETLPAHSMPGVGKQPEAVRWSEEETSRDSLLLLRLWLRVSTVDMQHPDVVSGQFSQCLLELLVSGDGDDITIRIPVLEVQVFAAFLQCLGEERGNALLELVVSHLSRSDLELAGHFAIGYLEVDHSCCCCSFSFFLVVRAVKRFLLLALLWPAAAFIASWREVWKFPVWPEHS